jgi:uncharacterized protein (DUF3820 family)
MDKVNTILKEKYLGIWWVEISLGTLVSGYLGKREASCFRLKTDGLAQLVDPLFLF